MNLHVSDPTHLALLPAVASLAAGGCADELLGSWRARYARRHRWRHVSGVCRSADLAETYTLPRPVLEDLKGDARLWERHSLVLESLAEIARALDLPG